VGHVMEKEVVAGTGIDPRSRVLLTGGAGFIGQHVLRALNAADIRPVASHLSGETLPHDIDADWIELDVRDREGIHATLRDARPDILIHLAATMNSERSYSFAEHAMEVNFIGTHNLMIAAGSTLPDLKRMVLLGSAEEYGNSSELPIVEHAAPRPVSPYSASKAAVTQYALLYNTLFRLPVVILRPFIVYGPGQTPSMMLPQLIRHALLGEDFPMTPGGQTRDFVYVDDVVECILLAATTPGAEGEVFNVCTGVETTIRTVAEHIVRIMRSDIRLLVGALPYRQNEAMRLFGSFDKARALLGWSPRTELLRGLQHTIDWFTHNLKCTT